MHGPAREVTLMKTMCRESAHRRVAQYRHRRLRRVREPRIERQRPPSGEPRARLSAVNATANPARVIGADADRNRKERSRETRGLHELLPKGAPSLFSPSNPFIVPLRVETQQTRG